MRRQFLSLADMILEPKAILSWTGIFGHEFIIQFKCSYELMFLIQGFRILIQPAEVGANRKEHNPGEVHYKIYSLESTI